MKEWMFCPPWSSAHDEKRFLLWYSEGRLTSAWKEIPTDHGIGSADPPTIEIMVPFHHSIIHPAAQRTRFTVRPTYFFFVVFDKIVFVVSHGRIVACCKILSSRCSQQWCVLSAVKERSRGYRWQRCQPKWTMGCYQNSKLEIRGCLNQ